jgi:short-subunit dehydrogenase/acyl carrier protein
LRSAVEFDRAVRVLAGSGHGVFIEVSPHPVLTAAITQTLEDVAGAAATPVTVTVTGTLRRDDGGLSRLLGSLAEAYVHGAGVDWPAVLGSGQVTELPTYAFQRQRYWPATARRPVAGGDGAETAGETRFWAAVEGGDVHALAAALAVDGRQPLTEIVPALAAWRRQELDRSVTAGWRYRVAWVPVTDPGPGSLSGRWLVIVPAGTADQDLPRALTEALTVRGARVVAAEADPGETRGELAARILAVAAAAGTAADGTGAAPEPVLAGVVSLLALDEGPAGSFPVLPRGLAGTQVLVQALGDAGIGAPLWVLTRGAVAAGAGEMLARPVQAMVWGLGRVAGLEHPGRWGGLVDLPPSRRSAAGGLDDRAAARLCAVLAGCGEDQVAIRTAGILARRLVRAPLPGSDVTAWVPRGSVLVTGGTGAVGGHVARWLAGRGTARVVLTGRSGPAAAGLAGLAAELAALGTRIDVVACDVAVRDQVAGLLARIDASGAPLTAVMHAAGATQATAMTDTSLAETAGMLAGKAAGAAHLDELTAGTGLAAFVLFSSISATWGSGLQPGYAAANAFLDALAQNRRSRGLPAVSVAWGAWAGGGMTDAESAIQLRRRGLRLMDPDLAVRALGQVLDHEEGPVTVADVDWARFAAAFTLRRPSPLIASLPEVEQALSAAGVAGSGPAAPGAGAELAQRLAGLAEGEQSRVLAGLVRTEAAAVLGYTSSEAVEAGRAFRDLGFDSVTAVELRNRLAEVTGLRLPATLVFDYPSPAALAEQLRTETLKRETAQPNALEELDRLRSLLSSMASEERRSEVAARLETMLRELRAGTIADDVADDRDLETASDDEMFDLVKREIESTDFEIGT